MTNELPSSGEMREGLRRRITELEAALADKSLLLTKMTECVDQYQEQLAESQASVELMREALRPFASAFQVLELGGQPAQHISVAHLRYAQETLDAIPAKARARMEYDAAVEKVLAEGFEESDGEWIRKDWSSSLRQALAAADEKRSALEGA